MKIKVTRVIALVLVLVALMSVFIIQLMKYQLVEGASYRAKSTETTEATLSITAARGQIVDRYGNVLATNKVQYNIVFQYDLFPTSSKKIDAENAMLLNLTKLLREKDESWNDSLPITYSKSSYSFTGSDSDLKTMRSTLKIDETVKASDVMKQLISRYGIGNSYSSEEKRTIAGIRYTMELKQFSSYNPYTFASDVSSDTMTKISERSDELPGVLISKGWKRTYTDGTIAPHVLGTLGVISSDEFKKTFTADDGYTINDIVGKTGIEKSMESYLKGTNGTETIDVDSSGNVVSENVTTEPEPGDTVVLTIDSKLQKVLQSALEETITEIKNEAGGDKYLGAEAKCGAAVVINRKTGEILAMASEPTFDLSTYEDNKSKLLTDADAPLYNRAVQGTYRPGSSFKPVTALAALTNGIITENTKIQTSTFLTIGGITFHSHNNGSINVITALAKSNNYFFYRVGLMTGIKKIDATGKMLGLNEKTGVELPNEASGTLAGTSGTWNTGDTVQAAIGQSYNQFTPLQLANYVATILNDGTRLQLHIVKQVNTYDNSSIVKTFSKNVLSKNPISEKIVDIIKEGMGQVTESGTATKYFRNYGIKVGGKTGTSQVGKYYDSVFVSFAPFDNPEIVVAAVVEHGYHGAAVALLARRVYDAYFYGSNEVSTAAAENTLLD